MRPSTEARFGLASLLLLQLMTSVAGVALLGRLSPAIERILNENVASTVAVEDMLVLTAGDGNPFEFAEALGRARSNVTEPGEVALVDRIERAHQQVVAQVPGARAELLQALKDLGELNRRSIARANHQARELGLAGAWAMALLGFAGFLVSLAAYRRIERRLLAPIVEIDAVLAAVRAGDRYRRCGLSPTSVQGARAAENLNWLLDRLAESGAPPPLDAAQRDALQALVDRFEDRPVVVGWQGGRVIALNRLALDAASAGLAPRSLVRRAEAGDLPEAWSVHPGPGGVLVLEGPAAGGGGDDGAAPPKEEAHPRDAT